MQLIQYVFNLTDSAVNKLYNVGDVWTLVWLKSKTELPSGFIEILLQLNVFRSWNPINWQQPVDNSLSTHILRAVLMSRTDRERLLTY